MCVRVSVSVISQARLEGVQDTEQHLAAGKSCAALCSPCPGDIFGDPSVPAARKRAQGSDIPGSPL